MTWYNQPQAYARAYTLTISEHRDNVNYFMWNRYGTPRRPDLRVQVPIASIEYPADTNNPCHSIEFHVGILTTSLPSLRPLFKSFLDAASVVRPSARDRSRKTNDYYGGGSNIAFSSRGPAPSDPSRNTVRYSGAGMLGRGKRLDKYGWDYSRRSSTDESILLEGQVPGAVEQQPQHGATTTRGARTGMTPSLDPFGQQASILRTTEISVTSNERAGRGPSSRSALRNVV